MKTQRPVSGETIPDGWFGELWDDVHACELSGGPGVRVNRTPDGTTVSAITVPAGGSGGVQIYNGYFVVIDASETSETGEITRKIQIIDGENPDSSICGQTDLGSVEKKTVEYDALPESGTAPVYLLVKYESGKYNFSFQIGGETPKSPTGFCILADINSGGVIRQLWTDGVIYFSERYYT